MDRPYIAQNNAERERMKALVERMSDEELSRPLPAGWTIAAVLAHIAFWDARGLYLMDKWEGGADPSEADGQPKEVDWINDAGKILCLALPPRTAAQVAVQTAEEIDRRVETMPDELMAKYVAAGKPFNLVRANHRKLHLDEIDSLYP
jgi:hypothetical protein